MTPVAVVMALVLTAIISGCAPTLIESIAVVPGLMSTTVLFDVRITDTVPEVRLATYTYAPIRAGHHPGRSTAHHDRRAHTLPGQRVDHRHRIGALISHIGRVAHQRHPIGRRPGDIRHLRP